MLINSEVCVGVAVVLLGKTITLPLTELPPRSTTNQRVLSPGACSIATGLAKFSDGKARSSVSAGIFVGCICELELLLQPVAISTETASAAEVTWRDAVAVRWDMDYRSWDGAAKMRRVRPCMIDTRIRKFVPFVKGHRELT